ncbi:hypothetical protein K438DRAFT_1754289 [Mycena galopus ATCC 62051]|nr:hypothetical protein K438DRAFT_1754289 [Mycena galopus ATCC 62051]
MGAFDADCVAQRIAHLNPEAAALLPRLAPHDCVDILQPAETLEHCHFHLDYEDHDGLDDESGTLVHSHLRKPFLHGLDNGLDAILLLLALPALGTVEIKELPDDPDSMLHFLEHHKVEYTSNVFALLQCPERRFLPSLDHIHLYRFHSQEREDYETMARALAARWHRSKECADIAQLCSFMLRIRLEDEVIEDFEEQFSPATDLEATGVDIAVKIWGTTW